MNCNINRFDTHNQQSLSFFRAHEHSNCFIDFCPTNAHLLASADTSDIAIWDIRNVSKRLYTIKSSHLNSMQFLKEEGIMFLVTSGNDVKVLDLRKSEEDYEAVK